ncbi:MAG: S8 family serine peptidase [Anaerolineae bacterium]|nr:S8 family serine peptidase [Anaerolineae bacterium]
MTDFITPDKMTNITDSQPKPGWHAWGGRFFLLAFLFWIITVTYSAQSSAWFGAMQFNSGLDWKWVYASLIMVGLTAVPLIPFAIWWPHTRYRAIFQTWLAATLIPLLLAPTRLLYPTQSQTLLLIQSLLLLLLALGLWWINRHKLPTFFRMTLAAGALAAGLAVLINLPFAWWGALGSPFDTLLALTLGLLFGTVAGLVIGGRWLHELKQTTQGTGWDMLTGGLVVGTALLIMSSGLSFNGVQLVLMLALPALGWVAMGIAVTKRPANRAADNSSALGLLVGLSAALILIFTDSDGIYLGAMDGIMRYAFQAAGVTILIALLAGFLLLLLRKRLVRVENNRALLVFALISGAIGVGLYLLAGQPGFYGDHLFVILKDQPDTSAAVAIADYDMRRQFVYDTLTSHATSTQADLRASLDRLGIDYTPYYLTNAIEVRGGLLHRLWLSTRPEVDHIITSPVMRPVPAELTLPTPATAPPPEPEWNLTNLGADRVWNELGVTGAGIVIGQSDSGADVTHPELQDSYRGANGNDNYNWFDPWQGTTTPSDDNGHGTHTLGTMLGNSTGVAPDAQWFACANLDRNLANPALYLDCLQFMLAPFPQGGDPFVDGDPLQSAHVLNNSWGCPEKHEGCDADSLRTAVLSLRNAGIFIVASAGNEGPACETIASPLAIYDEVFSVGAVDSNNNIAKFSSTGPVTVDGSFRTKPDIAAPGVDVLSALPGNSYGRNSGTSMAGPHVAGVVALMWSANPALIGDIERTEEILRTSATPFIPQALDSLLPADLAGMENELPGILADSLDQTASLTDGTCLSRTDTTVVPNNIAGYGIVNAYEAVKMALENED